MEMKRRTRRTMVTSLTSKATHIVRAPHPPYMMKNKGARWRRILVNQARKRMKGTNKMKTSMSQMYMKMLLKRIVHLKGSAKPSGNRILSIERLKHV